MDIAKEHGHRIDDYGGNIERPDIKHVSDTSQHQKFSQVAEDPHIAKPTSKKTPTVLSQNRTERRKARRAKGKKHPETEITILTAGHRKRPAADAEKSHAKRPDLRPSDRRASPLKILPPSATRVQRQRLLSPSSVRTARLPLAAPALLFGILTPWSTEQHPQLPATNGDCFT